LYICVLLVRIALCALCLGYYTHRGKEGYKKKSKKKVVGFEPTYTLIQRLKWYLEMVFKKREKQICEKMKKRLFWIYDMDEAPFPDYA
jgi:thioredoxin-related protein